MTLIRNHSMTDLRQAYN